MGNSEGQTLPGVVEFFGFQTLGMQDDRAVAIPVAAATTVDNSASNYVREATVEAVAVVTSKVMQHFD